MKKRIFSIVVTMCLILTLMASAKVVFATGNTTDFAGGSGTLSDPYLIANATHLQNMQLDLGASYKIINDFTMDGYHSPVGENETNKAFTGNLDGNYKTINNLKISGYSNQGIFGSTNGATIVNLTVNNDRNSTIYATGNYTGTFVGYAKGNLKMSNCHSNVKITGKGYTGGLVGNAQSATIIGCSFSGSIDGTSNVGGIVGKATASSSTEPTIIENCRVLTDGESSDQISGTSPVGGIVGELTGKVQYCYTTANVTGSSQVGGIAGNMYYSFKEKAYVFDSYSTGRIQANSTTGKVGGITGKGGNNDDYLNEINRCYASGTIYNKGKNTGGIVGEGGASYSYVKIDNSFALSENITQIATPSSKNYLGRISGMLGSYNSFTKYISTMQLYNASTNRSGTDGAGPITPDQAKQQGTYAAAGWTFSDSAWVMVPTKSPYPILSYWYEFPASVNLNPYNKDIVIKLDGKLEVSATLGLKTDSIKEWIYDKSYLSVETSGNYAIFTPIKLTPDNQPTKITVETVKGATADPISITIIKPDPKPDDVKTLTLALEVGQSCYVGGLTYGGGAVDLPGYTWSVDRPSILSVDQNGKVTGHSVGVATVTMTKDDNSFELMILVRNKPTLAMTDIVFDQESVDLVYKDITRLSYTTYPEDAADKTVLWESDNEEVVLVGEKTGAVSVVGSGIATITARCATNDKVYDTIIINATKPVTSVAIQAEEIPEFKPGQTLQLEAVVDPEDATNTEVTWSCAPDGIISIDQTGLVTGISAGRVNIYATADGVQSPAFELNVLSEFEETTLAEFKNFSTELEGENKYYALGGEFAYNGTGNATPASIQLIGAENQLTSGSLLRAKNWLNSTADNPKAWMIFTPTGGCTSLNVSFAARAANAVQRVTEFSLQYSIDGITWTTVQNYSLTTELATYTAQISIGSVDSVYLRLFSTSNMDNRGVPYNKNGTNHITNIIVTGLK